MEQVKQGTASVVAVSFRAGRGFKRRVLALWGFCFAERSPRGAAVEESCGSSLGVGGQRVRERVRVSPL